jgi:hypothetical protein
MGRAGKCSSLGSACPVREALGLIPKTAKEEEKKTQPQTKKPEPRWARSRAFRDVPRAGPGVSCSGHLRSAVLLEEQKDPVPCGVGSRVSRGWGGAPRPGSPWVPRPWSGRGPRRNSGRSDGGGRGSTRKRTDAEVTPGPAGGLCSVLYGRLRVSRELRPTSREKWARAERREIRAAAAKR